MTGSSNAWKRWGTAIGTVIVMVVGVLGAPPANAAPAAPGGLSPLDLLAQRRIPVLQWNRVPARPATTSRSRDVVILRHASLQGDDNQPSRHADGPASRGRRLVAGPRRGLQSGCRVLGRPSFRRTQSLAGPHSLSPAARREARAAPGSRCCPGRRERGDRLRDRDRRRRRRLRRLRRRTPPRPRPSWCPTRRSTAVLVAASGHVQASGIYTTGRVRGRRLHGRSALTVAGPSRSAQRQGRRRRLRLGAGARRHLVRHPGQPRRLLQLRRP